MKKKSMNMICLSGVEKEVEMDGENLFLTEKGRYVRIPERESADAYNLMKKFTEGVEELHPDELLSALGGNNAFSRFKKALADYPQYREKWFAPLTQRR